VYGIVKQSGGYIWVESDLGRGSSFYTLLPRVAPPPASSYAVQERLDFNPGGETILLVEDNPGVRKMSAEVLRNAGYNVIVAPNAADALRLAEEHKGQIHLLLTDVVMPGMTGPELAGRFSVLFPRVQVLYMTGYTDDAMMHHGFRKHARRLLQKPFTHEALERSVCEALESVP
jgi:CheY-like chemotaxis protein